MSVNGNLLLALRYQRDLRIDGGVYKACQCDFAYNSNHMEGSTLTYDQTVAIFDRSHFSGSARLDDIYEARNHFIAFDLIADRFREPISDGLLFDLHRTLKAMTDDSRDPVMAVGAYKTAPNAITKGLSSVQTASPHEVPSMMHDLIASYESMYGKGDPLDAIMGFHVAFERIHPFSDGNGRVGRLLMFKECLRSDIVPFILTADMRDYYLRGIRNYDVERGWLRDTLLTAQDRFAASYMPLADGFAGAFDKAGTVDSALEDAEELSESGKCLNRPERSKSHMDLGDAERF